HVERRNFLAPRTAPTPLPQLWLSGTEVSCVFRRGEHADPHHVRLCGPESCREPAFQIGAGIGGGGRGWCISRSPRFLLMHSTRGPARFLPARPRACFGRLGVRLP